MKVKRFYFVASPRGRVSHMSHTISEGGVTYCGQRLRKGWAWARRERARRAARRNVCKRCLGKM